MADRLSLKWVEGNTNATVAEITDETTFSVDDPTFWTPLSVLSGLASGYCERRAVLNSMFATDGLVEKNWYATGDTGSANRDEIARNCMHNLAVGSSGEENLYQGATSADFKTFGHAGTSNYMTAMDAAITSLISDNDSKYVTADNQDYDFGTLAAAAVIAAAATGEAASAISLPVSNGGTALNVQCGPALPVEWAKERKWMLEQLKWTPTAGTVTSYAADAGANYHYLSNGIFEDGQTAQAAYELSLNDADYSWSATTNMPDTYHGITTSTAVRYDSYMNVDVEGLPFKIFMQLSSEGTPAVPTWSMAANHNERQARIIGENNVMYLETAEPITGSVNASVYIDKAPLPYYPIPVTNNNETQYLISTVSTALTAANNVTLYKIVDGGLLTVPNGITVSNILIHSGGVLNIANGGRVKYCTAVSGGTVTGIKNIDYLTSSGMQVRQRNDYARIALDAGNMYTIIEGTQNESTKIVVSTGDSILASPRSYYIKSGGTLVFSATYDALRYMQSYTDGDVNLPEYNARIFVDSGGCLILKGSPNTPCIYVAFQYEDEYGNVSWQSFLFAREHLHDIDNNGTIHYCWHKAQDEWDPPTDLPDTLYTIETPDDYYDTEYRSTNWDTENVVLYENTGTESNPVFVATEYTIDSLDHNNYIVRMQCPIIIHSGGSFLQGAGVRLGVSYMTMDYGDSVFIAYPGATVQLSRNEYNIYGNNVSYGSGGFEYSDDVTMADTTNVTVYRMLEKPGTANLDWTNVYCMGDYRNPVDYSFVAFTDNEHLTVKPTIIDIVNADLYDYYAQDLPFYVHGSTATYTGDFRGTGIFNGVTSIMFNALDLSSLNQTSGEYDHVQQGWNTISVSSTALSGLKCTQDGYGYSSAEFYVRLSNTEWLREDIAVQIDNPTSSNVVALLTMDYSAPSTCKQGDIYYNTSTNNKKLYTAIAANTWSTEGESPSATVTYIDKQHGRAYSWSGTAMVEMEQHSDNYGYPILLYTTALPSQNWRLYSDAGCASGDATDLSVYSLAYTFLKGSTVSLPDSPTYGSFLGCGNSFMGGVSYAIYMCGILDLIVTTSGAGEPTNHYQDFYLRQNQLPGDPGYVSPGTA